MQRTCGTVIKLPRTKNKARNLFLSLLLLAFSFMIAFFIAELIVSNFFPQDLQKYELDSNLVHKPRANAVTRLTSQEYNVVSKTNSKGLLDYETDYDFDGLTIVALGDSFTEASHVRLEQGFTKILESKLKDKTKNSRVVNCGIGNTGTDQQYLFLRLECIKYKPRIVILNFYTGNDFANNYASLIYSYKDGKLIDKRPIEFTAIQRMLHFLNTRFHTVKLAERIFLDSESTRNFLIKIGLYKTGEPYQYNISLQDLYFTNSELSDAGFEKTFLILDELANYTNSNGTSLIVVIIPTKEQVDSRKYSEHFGIYRDTGVKINITQPNMLLADYLSRNNIDYIDLLPYFKAQNKNNSFYFEHDEHFNEKGHQLAANAIYENLIKLKLIS